MSKCMAVLRMMSLVLLGPCYRSPSKSFGELFEEKKSKLDALQATLAEAVMPKFPPMPAVKLFQPSIYDLWSIQPVSFLLAGCLFITTVALEAGMCTQ